MALHSLQIEKHVLGGLIQNPNIMIDVIGFISEKDFVAEPHGVIFSCLKQIILASENVDKVLLAQKITGLGISFKDKINIFDYIDAISFSSITPKATFKACQELSKLKALRELSHTCNKIQQHLEKSSNNPLEQTIAEVDALYGDKVSSFSIEDEPDDLFSDVYEMIESLGNNPNEEIGLLTPFNDFNRMYGGLRGGNVYAVASRAGQGKTTWLNHLACETGRINNVPALILDTEMVSKEIKLRTAAAFSGVPLWYLETGNWRKNADMVEKVRKILPSLKSKYKTYHYHVGNKHIDEVMAIMRRWYYKIVGRGNKAIIIYDYLKLTTEKVGQNWAEYQVLGEKVDKLKRIALELDLPIFSAIQINRTGENSGRTSANVVDDASAIAISDRLAWFATYLAILRRKTEDEIVLDTLDSGTHKLVEIKARYQGREAAGHRDLVLREFPDGSRKYVRNYLNFEISNFNIEERGTVHDAIQRQNSQFLVTDSVGIREETL